MNRPVDFVLRNCAALFIIALSSCQTTTKSTATSFPPSGRLPYGYEQFIHSEGYRSSRDIWKNDEQLALANGRNSEVHILRDMQRGRLFVNGKIAMDFPICSGKGKQKTPTGKFKISQKVKEYHSNLYGAVLNAAGNVVNGSATPASPIPEGGSYVPAEMPYWMRFNGAIGMHVGNVYREENSHGCVRVPQEACSVLFEKLSVGSTVIVE